MKKPGVDIIVGIGKPKPMPMKGGPGGMMSKPAKDPMAEMPEGDMPDDDEDEEDECMKRIESKLDKIMTALGLDEEDKSKGEMEPETNQQ